MSESMVLFQARRRRELEAFARGDRSVPEPATGIRPADPAQACKPARWWTDSHLNLTRTLADVWAGR